MNNDDNEKQEKNSKGIDMTKYSRYIPDDERSIKSTCTQNIDVVEVRQNLLACFGMCMGENRHATRNYHLSFVSSLLEKSRSLGIAALYKRAKKLSDSTPAVPLSNRLSSFKNTSQRPALPHRSQTLLRKMHYAARTFLPFSQNVSTKLIWVWTHYYASDLNAFGGKMIMRAILLALIGAIVFELGYTFPLYENTDRLNDSEEDESEDKENIRGRLTEEVSSLCRAASDIGDPSHDSRSVLIFLLWRPKTLRLLLTSGIFPTPIRSVLIIFLRRPKTLRLLLTSGIHSTLIRSVW
ncbi:hypothetical protein GQR58_008257 [Nymphon striatum]|nr:hypothetical protein GQR58_008257 [Nymphon striatum]